MLRVSGRYAGIRGAYFSAFWLIEMTYTLYADLRVNNINITLGNGAYRTLGHTYSACYTIIANF